jgi:hypothetical protein
MTDIFNSSKYTQWYKSIVAHAQAVNVKGVGYLEKHHIIPKSMGGTNDARNLVLLTARQHFVCHLLLTRMVSGKNVRKAWMALRAMAVMDAHGPRAAQIVVSSRLFEKLRVVNGEPNTPEVLAKKRAAYARRGPHSEQTRKKMRETWAIKHGVARKYLPPKEKRWTVVSPSGETFSCMMLEDFCRERSLYYPSLRSSCGNPVPLLKRITTLTNQLRINTTGWSAAK